MAAYYLGIDQGTTLTTALLVDQDWRIAARGRRAHRQIHPRPGWVEHDPEEIFECVLGAIGEALSRLPGGRAQDIIGLGLDHQGETCLIWDKGTGRPLYNAIVWQDRRTSDFAERLKKEHGRYIQETTGLWPDSYYTATKIKWLLDHVPGARDRAARGELLAGTLNTWLIWKLSGGRAFATDSCSGSRTMLMSLRTRQWDRTIAGLVDVPLDLLPPIGDCNQIFARTEPRIFWGAEVPICGSLSDSHAGLIGGGGSRVGTLKTSYGTGCFMNLVTGDEFVISRQGLAACCAWQIDGHPTYTLNGAAYIAGAAVEWLRTGLELIGDLAEVESLARSVPDTRDVYFVPAFAGLATPHWDQYARGAFLGLTGGVTKAHLVRSVLESVAFQTTDCYRAMKREYQGDIPRMRADGGMVDNEFLMQFQADLLGLPVVVPQEKESAAFGAAVMTAVTLGRLSGLEEIDHHVQLKKTYEPFISADERESRLARWLKAVERSKGWAKPSEEDERGQG